MSSMRQPGDLKPDSLENRIFAGTVVQNSDLGAEDGKKRQRIKVTVPGVLDYADGYTEATLPWCSPQAGLGDYAGPSWGEVDVPSIGAKVSVIFQDGRIDFPLYSPGYVDGDLPVELATNYPNRRGRVLKNGAFYWVDEVSGEMTYKLANGYEIFVDGEGSCTVTIPKDFTMNVGGNYHLTVQGNKTETIHGNRVNTVDGNSSDAVQGNKTETVHGNHSSTVDGADTNTVHGSRVSGTDGNSTTNVGGNNTTNVGGTDNLAVQGNRVSTIGGTDSNTVNGSKTEIVHGSRTSTISGVETVTAADIDLN